MDRPGEKELKITSFRVRRDLHVRLKALSAYKETSMQVLLAQAIQQLLEREGYDGPQDRLQ